MDAMRIESSICRLVNHDTVHFADVSSATTHTATALPASVASREDTRKMKWEGKAGSHPRDIEKGRAEPKAECAGVKQQSRQVERRGEITEPWKLAR